MFENLGIVTNIWSKCMASGDQFEELARQFGDNGFKVMEVRDGDYLRNSAFGELIGAIEAAMTRYTDDQWKAICNGLWQGKGGGDPLKMADRELFDSVSEFVKQAKHLTLSYAMSHPWLSPHADIGLDNQRILRAKKLAYLLCPHNARLRLVDLQSEGEIDPEIAVANLKRYGALLPNCPMVFAVENARQPALFTLDLAVQGDALLTYDEANTYREDGTTLNAPEAFWKAVKMETLTSVHFKQKTAEGVLSQVGDGFVDFAAIAKRLREGGYAGDLLLENTATARPLTDAIQSRSYLLSLL